MPEVVAPVTEESNPSLTHRNWQVYAMGLIILATIALAAWSATSGGLITGANGNLPAWLFLLLIAFAAAFTLLTGWALTGRWSGSLIDPTKGRMSLSRLQAILWTILVIPAFLAAVMINLSLQEANAKTNAGKPAAEQIVIKDPLDITIPGELLVAMGLSLGTVFVSRLVLTKQADENTKSSEKDANDAAVDTSAKSILVADRPQWRDLFRGDTVESRYLLDLGKLQLFYITIAILIGYGAVVTSLFATPDPHGITGLPGMSSTIVGLLAISHGGYLTNKAAAGAGGGQA